MNTYLKWTIFTLILILVVGGGFLYYKNVNNDTQNTSVETVYTLADVAKHNNKDDCWTTIEGSVYDITKFTAIHKGGEIILTACGIDATEKFNNRPGKGTAHSNLARKLLSGMKIGSLQK